MKRVTSIFVAVAIAGISAQAQSIISWDYANGTAIPTSGTAGVVPAINWNRTATGSTDLLDNSGASTGTTLTLAGGYGAWGIGGATQDPNGTYNSALFSGYYNLTAGTLSLGSIPYAQYDLYVYFSSDTDARTGTISDGTTTFSFSTDARAKVDAHGNFAFAQTTDTGLSHPSADYAEFSDLTGASKTLSLSVTGGGGFAGVQIVAVPEPGTMALAALGGMSLLFWRRRSMKSRF